MVDKKKVWIEKTMPDCAKVADVLAGYSAALEDLRAKVQQDRSVHCQELLNIYSEAVATGSDRAFIHKVSELIAARVQANEAKVKMDALEWQEHESKTTGALGEDSGVLRGGARGLRGKKRGKSRERALHYCGSRCNAYHTNLLKKLMHDRTTHAHELKLVLDLAGGMVGATAPLTQMVSSMNSERLKYNSRKTHYDAQQWRQLEQEVKGGGCRGMLRAGACA